MNKYIINVSNKGMKKIYIYIWRNSIGCINKSFAVMQTNYGVDELVAFLGKTLFTFER